MKRFLPILLLLTLVLILIGDQIQYNSSSKPETGSQNKKASPSPSHSEEHEHTEHSDDHSDPENNRRMGIFHFNEGNKSLQLGNFDAAVKNYEMALRHNPKSQESFINLSTTYLKAKDYDKALSTLQSLEKINPSHPLLHYNLACYYSLTEHTRDSLDSLKKAVQSGYKNFQEIKTDPDLENLRRDAAYREWMQSMPKESAN